MLNLKKYFKKNIPIDLLFLGIGLIVLIVFYFFFFRRVQYVIVRFKVTDENVLYATTNPTNQYAESFVVGDHEKNELGQVTSEILGVERFNLRPDQQVVYLDMKLKAQYNPRTNQYTLRGKSLLYGETFEFNLMHSHFRGIVVRTPGDSEDMGKPEVIVVNAQLRYDSRYYSDSYGVPDFIAKSVHVGDTVVSSSGRILAKITNIKALPAKRTIVTSGNQLLEVVDPKLMDLFLTLELSSTIINGNTYIFDFVPLHINTELTLNFKDIYINPVITDIVGIKSAK